MPVSSFSHFNLLASRELLDELRKFYCEVVGLSEGHRPPFQSFGYWLYTGGQPVLHLTEARPSEGRSTALKGTFDHAAFSCTNRQSYERDLTARGIKYHVAHVPETTQVQLFFADPAGNGVELNFDEADT